MALVLSAAPAALAEIFFIHNDHLGTPRAMTDKSGTVVWRAKYDPFGKATVEIPTGLTRNPPDLNLRFPGQYFDAETGLHYNYYRDYDPSIGRYLQPDPIGLDGGPNPYTYANNNPLRFTDPTGEFGLPGAAGAAAVNFGFQLFANLYLSNGDAGLALRCIDFSDVLISGLIGATGPTLFGNVIKGTPGPSGLTQAQNAYIYFTRSLPSGFLFKRALPPIRIADDCECKGLKATKFISELIH